MAKCKNSSKILLAYLYWFVVAMQKWYCVSPAPEVVVSGFSYSIVNFSHSALADLCYLLNQNK